MPEMYPNRCSERKVVRVSRVVDRRHTPDEARLLLGLEVVEEDAALLRLLTPVLDNDARAVDDLAGVALTVNLAYENALAHINL